MPTLEGSNWRLLSLAAMCLAGVGTLIWKAAADVPTRTDTTSVITKMENAALLSRDQAVEIAKKVISDRDPRDIFVLEVWPTDHPPAWIFMIYLKPDMEGYSSIHSAPLLVDRVTGKTTFFTGSGSLDELIASYEESQLQPRRQIPVRRPPTPEYLCSHFADLQRRIKRAWFPPKGSERERVVVRFSIHRGGELGHLAVDKTSGVAIADQAALKAVMYAAPFRPLPAEAPDEIEAQFTFDYYEFGGGGRVALLDGTESVGQPEQGPKPGHDDTRGSGR